ncbi:Uu.00g041310.m01.CDS01 [Anthostomella pinea]|uniref:Uu.00g041310.m01.CDS01 n=1 Tax=Anthostomella pinea TaxID=933095 RepID=A0AAI8V5E2_9PEZI|nr:Uu.00g041310.m01.CDS01 [Anthostomella pinea]
MTKTVCIVGAGPSGLVAAKTLLHDVAPGSFNVTIFDAQTRIGGLWPTRKDDNAGQVHPLMATNQSKHLIQFSDLAWRDSDPEFPRAWQVGQYLERYMKEYGGADIRLGHKVVDTELQDSGSWKVRTESDKGSETSVFDYLLVTTGFFGKPIWPDNIPKEGEVPIIHSSKYRDIKSLLPESGSGGDKILIVGGQMSGVEIAGTVATHLSSITHAPGDKAIPKSKRYSIHHVVPRPSWVFPLYTLAKPDAPAPPFLPVDMISQNLAVKPQPLKNTVGHISVDRARVVNSALQSMLGTDQSEFSAETKLDGDYLDQQPFIAVSPYYMDFVRSGLIKLHKGKLSSLSGTTAILSSQADNGERIPDIAAVILATGFDPSPSLAFLPQSVLDTLSHSPSHPNLPLALAFHSTHHASLPTLGFVGFYRAPYWGIMEMQARLIAALWTAGLTPEKPPPPALQAALQADDTIARTLALRDDPRCSQFPMGDYAFLMTDFARAVDLTISPPVGETPPLANGKPMDILTPARYLAPTASEAQRAQARQSLESTHSTALAGLSGGRFVAGAVFRSLLGEWRLEREIVSRLPSHPSGRFVGTGRFLLREGTADGREQSGEDGETGTKENMKDWGLECLYVEDGDFTASGTGLRFRATRRYVWRYDEAADRLGVWFARTDDAARADYLFHELEFQVPATPTTTPNEGGGEQRNGCWRARASHLCVEDLYDVQYEFAFRAVNLRQWRLGYTVRGPKKDYSIEGVYTRDTL